MVSSEPIPSHEIQPGSLSSSQAKRTFEKRANSSTEAADHSSIVKQTDGQKTVKWNQQHLDMLVKLKADGTSWTDIASKLDNGKTAAACRNMYTKVMKGKEIWTPALDQRLKDLYRKQRETMWLPIAAELGVDWHDVEARAATLGLSTIKNG